MLITTNIMHRSSRIFKVFFFILQDKKTILIIWLKAYQSKFNNSNEESISLFKQIVCCVFFSSIQF